MSPSQLLINFQLFLMYFVTDVEGVLDHLGLHQVFQQLDVLAPQAFLAWSGIEHFDVLLEVGERLAQLFEHTHGGCCESGKWKID